MISLVTLSSALNIYDVDHADPSDANYYLNPYYYGTMKKVQSLYVQLINQVLSISPNTVLVTHGYDYVTPRHNGPLIGVHMQARGLDPAYMDDLCRAIVHLMIDDFNARLQFIAAHHPTFRYVDLRGTVQENEWFDGEVHPNETAARQLAVKVANALGPVRLAVAARKEVDWARLWDRANAAT
jgi:hypothetical protein